MIVGRLMREFALGWPQSLKLEDGEELGTVFDLSESQIREMRVAPTKENYDLAPVAMQWLIEAGMVNCTRANNIRIMELAKAGLDRLNSLNAFLKFCSAQTRSESEEIVPELDRELAENFGPLFVAWLAVNKARSLGAESGAIGNGS
jgi:hypothetical protein